MGIELIGRTIIFNDTQANVEAETGALAELCFGRDTATGGLGYTIDGGITWVWLPVTAGGGDVYGASTGVTDGDVVGFDADGYHLKSLGSFPSGLGDVIAPATATPGDLVVFGADPQHIEDGGAVPISGSGADYILIRDEKSAGTDGGTFTAGAYRTRDLTTEVSDSGGHASVASNQITLAVGTYVIHAIAPGCEVGGHKAILQNITDAATTLVGTNAYTYVPTYQATTVSEILGKFTITGSKVFEIQHRCTDTRSGYGFGLNNNFGVVEVYTVVELWKTG